MVNRAVLSLLALTVGVQMLILHRQGSSPPASPMFNAVDVIAERGLTVSVQDAPRMGDSGARVAIVEFADFECPFCRRHATGVLPSLKTEFIDTGVAAYYYLHLPLKIHPHAVDAAEASECARVQGRFLEMHDLLFAQPESTPFTPAALRILAASLALEMATFDACIATAADRIAADVAQANRLSLGATPAFMLGTVETNNTIRLSTRINGAQPLEVFREAIDELGRVPSTEPRKYSALTTSQSMPVR